MPSENEVIGDPTNLGGMLRPNLPLEPTVGTHFTLLPCLEFDYCINLPTSVNQHSPITIFNFFFALEQMHILVENINKSSSSY
jgi:hypothetical protein